jgi:hypothetical protein
VRSLRAAAAALSLAFAALFVGGCAARSYMGIPFAAGAADPEVQALARRAQAGDKQAQLQLGIRYEEGRGAPRDLGRAERLYRLAGTDSAGTVYVYTPPAGRHGQGRVMPLTTGPRQAALNEARERLAALQAHPGRPPAAPSPVTAERPGGATSGARQDDSGFRQSERLAAAALDISGTQQDFFRRVAGPVQAEACLAAHRCYFRKNFDIAFGERTMAALYFSLVLSASPNVICDRAVAGSCHIHVAIIEAGDETSPHCARVDPLRRAAARYGWRLAPFRYSGLADATRYRNAAHGNAYLFIRTLRDRNCLKSISIIANSN